MSASSGYSGRVPDLDHLPHKLRKEWRRVFGAVRGNHDVALVAHRVDKALAASLRSSPDARSHVEALHEAAKQGDAEVRAVLKTLPSRWRCGLGSGFVHTARIVAAQSGKRGVPLAEFIRAGLRRMARQCCFGPIALEVVGTSFDDMDSYRRYVDDVLAEAQLDRIATSVMRHDDLSRVRAPARRQRPLGTKYLLERPL